MENIKTGKFRLSAVHLYVMAMLFTLLNNIAIGFMPVSSPLSIAFQTVGITPAPILCFLFAEEYDNAENLKKNLWITAGFAVVSQVFYSWFYNGQFPTSLEAFTSKGNIVITMLYCILFVYVSVKYAGKAEKLSYGNGVSKAVRRSNFLLAKQYHRDRMELLRLRFNRFAFLGLLLIFTLWCEWAFLPLIFMLISRSKRSMKYKLIHSTVFALIILAISLYAFYNTDFYNAEHQIGMTIGGVTKEKINIYSVLQLFLLIPIGLLLAIPILAFYGGRDNETPGETKSNGKLIAFAKQWCFYIFYVLHLFVLIAVRLLIS